VTATRVLRDAVRSAQDQVLRQGCDLASVNEALAELLNQLLPVHDQLVHVAAAEHGGPVGAILEYLRCAFGNAARGLPDPAVSFVVTAAATTYRLGGEDLPDLRMR
jgi:hypothetical protein